MRAIALPLVLGCALLLAPASPAMAQEERPRIGPIAIDIRGSLPSLPTDGSLAASRGLLPEELPGRAMGLDAGAHIYLFKAGPVTFGIGGQLTLMRASSSHGAEGLRPVDVRFTSLTPQLSFNFGTGDGWSYLSGGFGSSVWSIVPQGQAGLPADDERLTTFNYGGGARWFFKPHLAFTFDVRFHALDAGTIFPGGLPGSPRTRLLVMSAGISLK